MSLSVAARVAMTEPSLMAITYRKPRAISTTVWVTAPPSKIRAEPWVRLARPLATAASWSARSRVRPSEDAISSPSEETTMVWATPGTRSTKFEINQLRLSASWLIPLMSRSSTLFGLAGQLLGVAAEGRQAAAYGLGGGGDPRRRGDLGRAVGSGLARHQIRLRHPARQAAGGDSVADRMGERGGGLPSLVSRRGPGSRVGLGLGHRRRGRSRRRGRGRGGRPEAPGHRALSACCGLLCVRCRLR